MTKCLYPSKFELGRTWLWNQVFYSKKNRVRDKVYLNKTQIYSLACHVLCTYIMYFFIFKSRPILDFLLRWFQSLKQRVVYFLCWKIEAKKVKSSFSHFLVLVQFCTQLVVCTLIHELFLDILTDPIACIFREDLERGHTMKNDVWFYLSWTI